MITVSGNTVTNKINWGLFPNLEYLQKETDCPSLICLIPFLQMISTRMQRICIVGNLICSRILVSHILTLQRCDFNLV